MDRAINYQLTVDLQHMLPTPTMVPPLPNQGQLGLEGRYIADSVMQALAK